MCAPPRPLIPATPTRTVSLAPKKFPVALVPLMRIPAPAAAIELLRKRRRERRDMFDPPRCRCGQRNEIDRHDPQEYIFAAAVGGCQREMGHWTNPVG